MYLDTSCRILNEWRSTKFDIFTKLFKERRCKIMIIYLKSNTVTRPLIIKFGVHNLILLWASELVNLVQTPKMQGNRV